MDDREALKNRIEELTQALENAQAVIATMRDQLYAKAKAEEEMV